MVANGRVDDDMANELMAQMMYLERKDPSAPITMYINSQGGSVSSGLAIYDMMQAITPPVHTVCVGHAASMGAILLAAGAKGCRWAMPHSQVMIHQPTHSMRGKTTDIAIHAQKADRCSRQLATIISRHTNQVRACQSFRGPAQRSRLFDSVPAGQAAGLCSRGRFPLTSDRGQEQLGRQASKQSVGDEQRSWRNCKKTELHTQVSGPWAGGQADGPVHGLTDRRMDGWTDRWMDGWREGGADGGRDGRREGGQDGRTE